MESRHCRYCGSNLPDGTHYCGHCGAAAPNPYHPPQPSYPPPASPRINPMGLTAFVLGLVSFFIATGVTATLAIIFGAIARGQNDREYFAYPWMANWGLGLGIASWALVFLVCTCAIAVLA